LTGALVDAGSQRVLIRNVVRAIGPVARTLGLLGRTSMSDDEGMWFDGCNSIHTLFMRVPIDVVFLDRNGVVVLVAAGVKPNRPLVADRGARTVVELASGSCAREGIVEGMRLTVRWNSPT
jgi:uncharacterized membrane protein (UPF0127 family)